MNKTPTKEPLDFKMKNCIILFGQYRGNCTAIEYVSNSLPPNYDLILTTWNEGKINGTFSEVSRDLFLDLNLDIQIYDFNPYKDLALSNYIKLDNTYYMCNLILNSLESIQENYDKIFLQRLDLLNPQIYEIITGINDSDKIRLEIEEKNKFVNDYIFYGNKQDLIKLFKGMIDIITETNPNHLTNEGAAMNHRLWYDKPLTILGYKPISIFEELGGTTPNNKYNPDFELLK